MTTQLSPRLRWTLAAVALLAWMSHSASAVPATPAWRALELRAEHEGAAAVREQYQRDIRAILDALDQRAALETGASDLQATLSISWLFQYLGSWAYAEAREVRMRTASAAGVPAAVPLLDSLASAQAHYSAGAARRRGSRATPDGAESSTTISRGFALRQVALWAKLVGDGPMLGRVFEIAGSEIDSCRTPAEFLALQHDFDALLLIPVPRDSRRVARVVTEEEEAAVRELVASFWQASVRGDSAGVERLFLRAETARSLVRSLSETTLLSVDLAEAKYEIRHLEGDRWKVRVNNVEAVKLKNGQPTATVGGKTFEISLRDSSARILSVGGVR